MFGFDWLYIYIYIYSLRNTKKHKFNLPKAARNSISKLKDLVRNKVIDIPKVGKGAIAIINQIRTDASYRSRLISNCKNIKHVSNIREQQNLNKRNLKSKE